jgi:hypothetical protein
MMRALMTKTLFVLSILLSAQALAFDVGGLSYTVILGTTNVEVTGRASGNSDTDINIPDTVSDGTTTYSVTIIGDWAFLGNNIISVTIGNSVESIEDGAFANTSLISLVIPDSVKTISYAVFADSTITSVTIGNSVESIGGQAFSNNNISSVIIPDSVKTIGDSAFQYNALTSVIIPDTVKTIGDGAFSANDLSSITIPDSVKIIGYFVFNSKFGNLGLTGAAFEGEFGDFDLRMFSGNPSLATITYCQGAKGWPQTFDVDGYNNFPVLITTTSVDCSPAAPGAPIIESVKSGDSELTVRFSVPSDGGASIESYTVTCGSQSATGNTSPITVSSLSNDVQYSCAVAATNAVGTGPASAPSSGKPEKWIPTGLPIWLLYEASKPASP